jgi:hypothetical protein
MSAAESRAERSARETWEGRRTHQNIWTKTDTARWLEERNAEGLAWMAAHTLRAPRRPVRAFGYWLKLADPAAFARVHARLGATPALRTGPVAAVLA